MSKGNGNIKVKIENRDRIDVVMTFLSLGFVILSIAILVKIVIIQTTYKVPPSVEYLFRPREKKVPETPVRGKILSHDGRPLAISAPLYDLYMDCAVLKRDYATMDREEDERIAAAIKEGKEVAPAKHAGAEAEKLWRRKADTLSRELASIFPEKSADRWYSDIIRGRETGNRYFRIHNNVSRDDMLKVRDFHLYRDGQNTGGLIVREHEERIYPYDSLARRAIGYVKDTRGVGVEVSYDRDLRGEEGYEWRRITDDNKWVLDLDSTSRRKVDGSDVRTTLNIDFQQIADKALRRQITPDEQIRAGIAVIMEVETGAIRAMVNLSRDTIPGSRFGERDNLVLKEVGEQGSVMKTVTLTTLVEDGYVKNLQQTIPTKHGFYPGGYPLDQHIMDYERENHTDRITVKHGFEISSNYVFTYLAEENYKTHPTDFFDKIYSYCLGDKIDFDLGGMRTPIVNRPGTAGYSGTTLGTTAYGYGISVTPLHVVTFYNGLAGKGRMMKPYLVESIEKDGRVIKKFEPMLLNNICRKETADTVTRALMAVTSEGTAQRLKGAKLTVAGKTGTAQVVVPGNLRGRDPYHDKYGRKMNQGTFVGFFPAENPKYTILVTVYSYLSHSSFYGGTKPAAAVREIVDRIYAVEGCWGEVVSGAGPLPEAGEDIVSEKGTVPDVRGLSLSEALFAIESAGLRCTYEGMGHVASEETVTGEGGKKTVKLILK